jgi:hypothetical protein
MYRMTALIALLVVLLACTGASAQQGGGAGAKGPMYNPKTVETITGEVVAVETATTAMGGSYGIHMVVKTEKGTIPVHLGPAWYIENQGMKLAAGDRVEVTGSLVTFEGKPAIIAGEVKKGGRTLTLRDASGFPVWAGRRRG